MQYFEFTNKTGEGEIRNYASLRHSDWMGLI